MTVWYISPCFGKTDNSTPGGQRGFPSHTSSRAWQHDAVVISVMKISDTTPCLALNLVYNVICLSDRFRSLPTGNPEATEPNSSQNSLSIHQHQTPPASLSIRQRCLNPLQIFGYTTKTRTGRQTHRSAISLKKPPSKLVDKQLGVTRQAQPGVPGTPGIISGTESNPPSNQRLARPYAPTYATCAGFSSSFTRSPRGNVQEAHRPCLGTVRRQKRPTRSSFTGSWAEIKSRCKNRHAPTQVEPFIAIFTNEACIYVTVASETLISPSLNTNNRNPMHQSSSLPSIPGAWVIHNTGPYQF